MSLSSRLLLFFGIFRSLLLVSSTPAFSANGTRITANNTGITANGTGTPQFSDKRLKPSDCENVALAMNKDSWDLSNTTSALEDFLNVYQNNLLFCEPCRGLKPGQCPDDQGYNCSSGLNDAVKSLNNGQTRWDSALALYASLPGFVSCGTDYDSGCSASVTCAAVHNSSSSLMLMQSTINLSKWVVGRTEALKDARVAVLSGTGGDFNEAFIPVPDTSMDKMGQDMAMSAIGFLLGEVPGVGGLLSTGLDIANSALESAQEEQQKELEKPVDMGKYAQSLFEATHEALNNTGQKLFIDGSIGKDNNLHNMTTFMANASLLDVNPNLSGDGLADTYAKIMFQQLIYYAWTHLQKETEGKSAAKPFITFAPAPASGHCEDLDYDHHHFVPFSSNSENNLKEIDSYVVYNNTCYWLLSLTSDAGMCNKLTAMPGGTISEFNEHGDEFGKLSLIDFIIPSVEGWVQNNKINRDPQSNPGGAVTSVDIHRPGIILIPVCDYMKSWAVPGEGCPIYDAPTAKVARMASGQLNPLPPGPAACNVQKPKALPQNDLISDPYGGSFVGPNCRVDWRMWKPGRELDTGENPIQTGFQFSATIFDADNRVAGNAAKQYVASTWAIENTKTPYTLYIAFPGIGEEQENDPLRFWYDDQYWNSLDPTSMHSCQTEDKDWNTTNGYKEGNCAFWCPEPPSNPHTEDSLNPSRNPPLPDPPEKLQRPVSFGDAVVHKYTNIRRQYKEIDRSHNPDQYNDPYCWVRITQWWWNYRNVGDMQYQAYVGKGRYPNSTDFLKPEWSAQVVLTTETEEPVYGAKNPLTVRFSDSGGTTQDPGKIRDNPIHFKYLNAEWDSTLKFNLGTHGDCRQEQWYDTNTDGYGSRQFWCFFQCEWDKSKPANN